jgi:hypothetical protein
MYTVEIERQLPADRRERFISLMEAYQMKAYNDMRYVEDDEGSMAKNLADYDGLFNQLGVTDINTYMEQTVAPMLAEMLDVNPALVLSILNQIKSVEKFHANVNDADAQGFDITINGWPAVVRCDARTLEDIRNWNEHEREAHSHTILDEGNPPNTIVEF